MNVVAYYRTNSSGNFEKKIGEQKKAVKEYCEENDLVVIQDLTEACSSSKLGPGLCSLAEKGRELGAEAVVVMNLDRISRSITDLMAFYQKMAGQGMEIISTKDNVRIKFHIPGQEKSR